MNKKKLPETDLLTAVSDRLSYDQVSGQLKWKKKLSRFVVAGTRRTQRDGKTYIIVRVDDRWVRGHVIAWFLATGDRHKRRDNHG